MEITIDRISNSGNPIAETEDGTVLVFGAEAGETLDIHVKTLAGSTVGIINNPTEEQCKRALDQMSMDIMRAQRRYAANHYRTRSEDLDDMSATLQTPMWQKEISEEEKEAAKDQSKSLEDIAQELGEEVTETQQKDHTQKADHAEDSGLAKEISRRHD